MTSKFLKKKRKEKENNRLNIVIFCLLFFIDINGTKIFVVVRVSFSVLFCGVEV